MENNPKYANLAPVVESGVGKNHYFFCDQADLRKNLALLKRMPHLMLLGGLIHDRLVTRNGVLAFADMEPLDIQHGQLSNTLNQFLAATVNTLSAPIKITFDVSRVTCQVRDNNQNLILPHFIHIYNKLNFFK